MSDHPCKFGECAAGVVVCSKAEAIERYGKNPTLGVCLHACSYYDGPERTPELIDANIREASNPLPIRLDCRSLGGVVDRVECATCGGRVRLKVYACERFKRATIATPVEGAACCATCDDYEPTVDPTDRETGTEA